MYLSKKEYATYMRLERALASKNWDQRTQHQPDYARAASESYDILGYSPRRGRF